MLRTIVARVAVGGGLVAALCSTAGRAAAQTWNDPRTRALVELATTRRAAQLADTALVDYRAEAHGYVTFLAQMGEGFPEPPRIVKADELALTVYWHAPNLSKQVIQGRRDTLLLPTDIQYHRDHLGIVQNNFPNIIRLGEGDEVRDVPHPLSPRGLEDYDFAIADSLRITLPGRVIDVYEVKVRPRDDREPRVIGAVYIDRSGGQVVRMAFSFTHAAFLDKQLEDLSIVLENGLVGGRFWLPRRQEIEIRRTGTWMDYPVRGLIRGRWEIENYEINTGVSPSLFAGPEIVQVPRETQRRYEWKGAILDSLPPDVRAVTDADIQRVQTEARALVRAQALQRARTMRLSARGISDFARVDRAQGLSLGTGLTQRLGAGFTVTARGRYGIDDERLRGTGRLAWQRTPAFALHARGGVELRDVGIEAEHSTFVNSIAAQEFGSDYTDPYQVTFAGVGVELPAHLGLEWRVEAEWARQRAVPVQATPANGRFEPTLPIIPADVRRLTIAAERPTALALFGTELRLRLQGDVAAYDARECLATPGGPTPCDSTTLGRISAVLNAERPMGTHRLVLHTIASAAGASGGAAVPLPELLHLGGPVTAPGYDFHRFVGTAGVSQRVEWQLPIPFPSVNLGRFGRTPSLARLAVVGNAVYVTPALSTGAPAAGSTVRGAYPSAGLGLLTFFDLLRFDVARGLRDGRWTFSVDVSRDLWGIL
jgi:hypothetical protein